MIIVFACIKCTTTEILSNDNNPSLTAETNDYKSNENTAEINPINEGFIIFSDNQKKYPLSPMSSTSASPIKKKETSISRTLSNTTATTKTKHQLTPTSTSKTTTTTLTKTPNYTANSTVNHPSNRRGRRLLHDSNYDTDMDTSTTNTSLDNESDMGSFLKVNDEELSNQLLYMSAMAEGSGETSMYQLNIYLYLWLIFFCFYLAIEDTTEETTSKFIFL
jgi:hypothetical protein